MIMRARGVVTLLFLATYALACVPALRGPHVREPNRQLPERYAPVSDPSGEAEVAVMDVAQGTWQTFFADPHLQALINTALMNNQELNLRLQELVILLNEANLRSGEYLPKIAAQAGIGAERVGRDTREGRSDEITQIPKNLGNFTFGLVGSWEADVFSRLRNAKKAADFRYFAGTWGQKFLVTQIVAEVARSYYELVAIDSQLEILGKNIKLQEDTLAIVKLEKQAARVTELAVQRFEAELLRYKGRIFAYKQEQIAVENRINFLVGRYPQPVKRTVKLSIEGSLPASLTGLPSQLLTNRPDVRQAELNLAAAKFDVKSAKAAFYPSLTIDAAAGYRAFNAAHLVSTPASVFYNAAGGLVAPLINRRGLHAQFEMANASQVQAVYNYERALLGAFTDVANQMAAVGNWHKMHGLLAEQVDTLAQAVGISTVLFQAARAEYIEVLTTRRDYLEAQLEMIEANKKALVATVGLYQALGGGWRRPTADQDVSYQIKGSQ